MKGKFKTEEDYRKRILRLYECSDRLNGLQVWNIDALHFLCNKEKDNMFDRYLNSKKEAKKTIKAADLKNTKLKAAEKAEPVVKEEKTAAKKTTKSASTKTAATKVAATKTAEKAPKTEKTAEKTTKSVEKTTKTTKKAAETKAEPKTTKKSTTAKKEAK